MPKRNDLTISKRTVDGLSAAEDTVFWDHDLPGFGIRVYPTGRKVYVVQSRGPGGPKRVTLGRHGDIRAEQARGKAARRHRPHQAGRGSGPSAASARAHRRRSGGALHGGACGGELQCAHRRDLPGIARQPYPAGIGRADDRSGWAGSMPRHCITGFAIRPARQTGR